MSNPNVTPYDPRYPNVNSPPLQIPPPKASTRSLVPDGRDGLAAAVSSPPFAIPPPAASTGSIPPDGTDGLAQPVIAPPMQIPAAAASTGSLPIDGTDGLAQSVIAPPMQILNATPINMNWAPVTTPPVSNPTAYVESTVSTQQTQSVFGHVTCGNGIPIP